MYRNQTPPPVWPDPGPMRYADLVQQVPRGIIRSQAYVRLLPGIYLPTEVEPEFVHRIAAWRLSAGPEAVLGGIAAAVALGVPWFDDDVVELIQPAPQRIAAHRGVRVRADLLRADEITETAFGLVTSGARTAYDLSRRMSLPEAVARADAVLRATDLGAADLAQIVNRNPGARHIRQARVVAHLADPRAESPQESRLRVVLIEAGVWGLEPQVVVRDERGKLLAEVDLANAKVRVGFEYEGSHHLEPGQFTKDLVRYAGLEPLGWTMIRIDAPQMRDQQALLRSVRRRAPQVFSRHPTPGAAAIAQFREQLSHQRRTRRQQARRVRP